MVDAGAASQFTAQPCHNEYIFGEASKHTTSQQASSLSELDQSDLPG
jgi:hypothetical protein